MQLPAADTEFLRERGLTPSITVDGGMICVRLDDWPLPSGLQPQTTSVLFRLSPGYPDVPPDMWWMCPPVSRTDGAAIPATEHSEPHLGQLWQRWSRHLQPGQWRAGVDGLQTFVAILEADLKRQAANAA